MVVEHSKNARIIKIFQLEVVAFASKIINPEVTVLSYVVQLSAQLGKALNKRKFLKYFLKQMIHKGFFTPDFQRDSNSGPQVYEAKVLPFSYWIFS